MIRVLVIEDDEDLNFTVCRHLNMMDFQAIGCTKAVQAFDMLFDMKIDVIVSDVMMPGMDGFELVSAIRNIDQNIPIIFMTAREDFLAKEKGFRLGIDDYMVKPIILDELVLRIHALLRRSHIQSSNKLIMGELEIDAEAVSASYKGQMISLTLREFQILFKLLSYPNKTFTRSQLIEEFSGIESESGLRTVDVFITNLRAKFAMCDEFSIKTVYGLGYKAVVK